MVKIRDLSDNQLVSQIEKYKKILDQLYGEREKRASDRGGVTGLLTRTELEVERKIELKNEAEETPQEAPPVQESAPKKEEKSQSAFQLSFDEDELQQMKEKEEEVAQETEEDDEVRVTQLLRLSQDQLKELADNKAKIKKKKVVKKVKKK